MKCPFCGAEDTKVIDSRGSEDSLVIKRRRQCIVCGRRFTTVEKIEAMTLRVVKKDNTRENFDRSKIEMGILRSCHKRPVSSAQILKAVDEFENELYAEGEAEVPTSLIGEKVMSKLKDLDQVAYVRFASVYREFKDVNTFVEEIGELLKK